MPLTGLGGQTTHEVQSRSKRGFGGGVINIFAEKRLTLKGKLSANGGKSETKDHIMVAGGAGGSVKLSSHKITIYISDEWKNFGQPNFSYQFSVAGGDPDADTGAGSGGKVILDCLSWSRDHDCIQLLP